AEIGAPLATISTSVDARVISYAKKEREHAASLLPGPKPGPPPGVDKQKLIADVRAALYAAKAVSYAQGMNLLRLASETHGWGLKPGELRRIGQAGSIIRAQFLARIKAAYARDAPLQTPLLAPSSREEIAARQEGWRNVAAQAAGGGLPLLTTAASLGYYDM